MGFALDASSLYEAHSYADAKRLFEGTKPLRDSSNRPLDKYRRKPACYMNETRDGSIQFVYHHTHVVTWHPNNSCTVKRWSSTSTDAFASCYLPRGVESWFSRGGLLDVNGELHNIGPIVTLAMITGKWRIVEGDLYPFEFSVLNKSRAAEALKESRYKEYKAWEAMVTAMGSNLYDAPRVDHTEIYALLPDQKNWPSLFRFHIDSVRKAIYRAAGCYDTYAQEIIPATYADYRYWEDHQG